MHLMDKVQLWSVKQKQIETLKEEIKKLEDEISKELPEGSEIKTESAVASYKPGRGSYNYEQIAYRLEPDEDIIAKHTKPVTNWNKVCQDAGMTDELKKKFYVPGETKFTIKLLV